MTSPPLDEEVVLELESELCDPDPVTVVFPVAVPTVWPTAPSMVDTTPCIGECITTLSPVPESVIVASFCPLWTSWPTCTGMAETFPEPANASWRVRGLTTVPEADEVASTVPRPTVVVRRVEDWAVLDEPWSVMKTPAAIRTRTTTSTVFSRRVLRPGRFMEDRFSTCCLQRSLKESGAIG